MRYRIHLIIATIIYAIFIITTLDGVRVESIKINLNDLINNRVATSYDETGPGECCTNGWKMWNVGGTEADGKDCWCEEREDVSTDCTC